MNVRKKLAVVFTATIAATMAAAPVLAQSDIDLSTINLPPGFSIEVWTDDVPNARSMALGDDGTVFVATRRDGRVYAVVPRDAATPRVITLDRDRRMPNGIAVHDGDLYIADLTRISRYPDIAGNLEALPEAEIVADDLPSETHHGWRYIDFGPDGNLYISIGAPCNVCDREGFGNISRVDLESGAREVVAYGVRNSVGFTWHPDTGHLWFSDNGRDMLGDDIPPGEINHAPIDGLHFGFPFCHGGDIADPEFGDRRDCDEFTPPAQKLGPHVAPLGIEFYTGGMFPDEYQGQLFIAEHGSWNRSRKIGYRITLVRMEGGRAAGYETFADGWLQGEEVLGRPVDVLVLADGSMLVSDDRNGAIYRISYTPSLDNGVAPSGEGMEE